MGMEEEFLWPLCQSCARPLIREKDFGTNADGTRNEDYCSLCYQKGAFTQPAMTQGEMIENVANQIILRTGMPRSSAEEIARSVIPTLKRWR
ncbi:MAG: zinc ribbon domain-containing protein [Methanomicrobiales archaeon]|nr:zinc ribbon domain-containing protein [Methanomicrobiales archaeon]